MTALRPSLVLFCVAIFSAFAAPAARGDIAVLGVKGPQSATGFSNIGAMSGETVLVIMNNAEVLIELESLKGDVLAATCTAVFEMETDANAAKEGQTLLVAFPLTMSADDVAKITDFELTIDGVRKRHVRSSNYLLSDEVIDPTTLFWGGPPAALETLKIDPEFGELFGYRMHDDFPAKGPVLSKAYAWQQTFSPGAISVIQIKYRLTLYAQPLAYSKTFLKGQSRDVIPFDLMWAGESDGKAFFLDYILRSGATWMGPIGNETVILKAAKSSGIIFEAEDVVVVGRHRFEGASEDLRKSTLFSRVGIDPWSIAKREDALIWSIVNEDPKEDILVQIPVSAVRNTAEQND